MFLVFSLCLFFFFLFYFSGAQNLFFFGLNFVAVSLVFLFLYEKVGVVSRSRLRRYAFEAPGEGPLANAPGKAPPVKKGKWVFFVCRRPLTFHNVRQSSESVFV